LHYFRLKITKELALAVESGFHIAKYTMLFSQTEPAVRHAAIAVGALAERFRINSVLTWDNAQANAQHEFAVSQYYKAMALLRKRLESAENVLVDFALLTCFLFLAFAFLAGESTTKIW
jgi:hypothetical protein